jgi:cysteine synthase
VGKFPKGESLVEAPIWLVDPPVIVLCLYVQSGGKLKERSGGSIAESLTLFPLIPSKRMNGREC